MINKKTIQLFCERVIFCERVCPIFCLFIIDYGLFSTEMF